VIRGDLNNAMQKKPQQVINLMMELSKVAVIGAPAVVV
jgi:hypothetical protein